MLSEKLAKAINTQINKELYSSYLYLSMSAEFKLRSLMGFGKYLANRSKEEYEHAEKFKEFLIDMDTGVEYSSIDKPDFKYASPIDTFKKIYDHEVKVTESIHNLMDLSVKEKNYPLFELTSPFVTEQIEEMSSIKIIIDKLNFIKDDGTGLLFLDKEFDKD